MSIEELIRLAEAGKTDEALQALEADPELEAQVDRLLDKIFTSLGELIRGAE